MVSLYTNWEAYAKRVINVERNVLARYPGLLGITLNWKDNKFTGCIQVIVPEYSPEIVLLTLATESLKFPSEFYRHLKEFDPNRLELIADESIDLTIDPTSNLHLLRRSENRLIELTAEQFVYMTNNPPIGRGY